MSEECNHENITARISVIQERPYMINVDGMYDCDPQDIIDLDPEFSTGYYVCDDCGQELPWKSIKDKF
jgi:hypothetical protein